MANEKPYHVLSVRDSTYLDKSGEAIDGKAVRVEILEFDEITTFRVPGIQGNAVSDAVMLYIEERRLL